MPNTVVSPQPVLYTSPFDDQVVQHRRDHHRVVAIEALEQLAPRRAAARRQVLEHGLPQRAIRARVELSVSALHLLLIRAHRHAEHVGDDLAPDALRLDLARQLEEHLIGDVRERRADAGGGRELRDQHRRLAHDRVDQTAWCSRSGVIACAARARKGRRPRPKARCLHLVIEAQNAATPDVGLDICCSARSAHIIAPGEGRCGAG